MKTAVITRIVGNTCRRPIM